MEMRAWQVDRGVDLVPILQVRMLPWLTCAVWPFGACIYVFSKFWKVVTGAVTARANL